MTPPPLEEPLMRSPAKHRILRILRIWVEKKSHNPSKLSYVFEKKIYPNGLDFGRILTHKFLDLKI
jgi:hypothetical protein